MKILKLRHVINKLWGKIIRLNVLITTLTTNYSVIQFAQNKKLIETCECWPPSTLHTCRPIDYNDIKVPRNIDHTRLSSLLM